jgi:molybdopterin/thiamine biosynthesis adenylyltransferase
MKKEKLTIKVLIENNQIYTGEFNINQKLHVIVNKATEHLNISADGRELRREDGTPLPDLNKTIEDVGIYDNEVLKFLKKAPKPDRDKGFAFVSWHEKKENSIFHDTEVQALKNGLGGHFVLKDIIYPRETRGRVIATGSISFNSSDKEDVLIIFPTHYPYGIPRVLIGQYDANNAASFTAKQFGKGNQYADGSLCLIRKKDWRPNLHNVGWLLRRIQKWLEGATRPRGFRPDEIVEEFPAYMPHIGQVILPSAFDLPKNSNSGSFQLTEFKPHHFILEQNVLPSSPFLLNVGVETFRWFRFPNGVKLKELMPVANANELAKCILTHFHENIGQTNSSNIAFYIPDEATPWHFFRIIRMGNLIQLLYLVGRTTSNELFKRSNDLFNSKLLRGRRVVIIGLGALGSEVAVLLARNGVGIFDIFDLDVFELGNSIRHAADIYYIGERKTQVASQLILRSNPDAIVNAYDMDVLDDVDTLEKVLTNADLCIVLTAEDNVDYMINDHFASKFKIPFIFGRVSTGAMSGSIQVVEADTTACLRCLSANDVDTLPVANHHVMFEELPMDYGNCSDPATPGSGIDTMEIALQLSRIALGILDVDGKYPKVGGHQFYWHGPAGSANAAPFTWEVKSHPKNSTCHVCNKKS